MCLAEFKGFAQLCLCRRRVRIRNFVFPALVTAFSPQTLLGLGVFKLCRVLVRKVPSNDGGRGGSGGGGGHGGGDGSGGGVVEAVMMVAEVVVVMVVVVVVMVVEAVVIKWWLRP